MELVSVLSVLVTASVAIFHAILDYKRSKEPPKDEVWDAALKLAIASGDYNADTFAHIYEELKAFKDNGCSLDGEFTIIAMVKKRQGECKAEETGMQQFEADQE